MVIINNYLMSFYFIIFCLEYLKGGLKKFSKRTQSRKKKHRLELINTEFFGKVQQADNNKKNKKIIKQATVENQLGNAYQHIQDECSILNSSLFENFTNELNEMNHNAIQKNELNHRNSTSPGNVTDAFKMAVLNSKISRSAVNIILKALNPFVPDLPLDYRSLLGTDQAIKLQDTATGKMISYNWVGQLSSYLAKRTATCVTIDVHVDELKLAQSVKRGLWVISVRIREFDYVVTATMHEGKGKPPRKEFLRPIMLRINQILKNGIEISEGRIVKIKMGVFCADTPARAYLLHIVTMGCNGCHLCTVKGSRRLLKKKQRMHYPGGRWPRRTTSQFRRKHFYNETKNLTHHLSQMKTEIEEIENFDILKHVAPDPMHASESGLVKAMLGVWEKRDREFTSKIDLKLNIFSKRIPSDFQRHCRSVNEDWKATECRLFLIYLAPFVLKNIIPDKLYFHFLKLVVAMRIMSSRKFLYMLKQADELIQDYVNEFCSIYESEPISFNLHLTTHLPKCCYDLNATLEDISCFWGENHLQVLRNDYKMGPEPIKQVAKRISEKLNNLELIKKNKRPKFQCQISKQSDEYRKVNLPNMVIDTFGKNQYVRYQDSVIKVLKITKTNDLAMLEGVKVFGKMIDVFLDPVPSRQVGIFMMKSMFIEDTNYVKFSEIYVEGKYLTLHGQSSMIFIELLHVEENLL